MKLHILLAGAVAMSVACPLGAQAQSIPEGAAHGAYVGNQAAGPVGGFVGGIVGGFIGGVDGLFGIHPVSYSPGEPYVYPHHRHWRRHAYHRYHHQPTNPPTG